MDIALVFCPQFANRGAPLGMAYIQAALKSAGHRVTPFDLETLLIIENAPLYKDLFKMINIGVENDTVHFVLRPDVLLWSFYESDTRDYPGSVAPNERQVIREVKKVVRRHASLVLERKPQAVMFSVFIGSVFFSSLVAREIRKADQSIPIVFGGPGCSHLQTAELLLRMGHVDCCVIGEGERSAVEIAEFLEKTGGSPAVPGAAVLEDGKPVYTPRAQMDLNKLPVPDFTGFPFPGADFRAYLAKYNRLFVPVASSRGCTLKCAFCGESALWGKFRVREPRAVVAEMLHQKKRYRTNIFYFCDSLVNPTQAWLNELCDRLIQCGEKILIDFAYLRARALSKKTIRKMADAGFRHVVFGVESASAEILEKMGKGTDVAEMKRIIKDTVSCEILCGFALIAHLPGETRDDVWRNFDFIYSLERELSPSQRRYLYYNVVTRFRVEAFSKIYRRPEKYGITVEPYSIPIPEAARHLEETLDKVLLRWSDAIGEKERNLRYQLYLRHDVDSHAGGYVKDYATPVAEHDRLVPAADTKISETTNGKPFRYKFGHKSHAIPLSNFALGIIRQIQQEKTVGQILRWARKTDPFREKPNEASIKEFLDLLVRLDLVRYKISRGKSE